MLFLYTAPTGLGNLVGGSQPLEWSVSAARRSIPSRKDMPCSLANPCTTHPRIRALTGTPARAATSSIALNRSKRLGWKPHRLHH